MITGIATIRPAAVVMSAWPTPLATTEGSPVPSREISPNAMIIPVTVPRRPSIGATWAMVARGRRPRVSFCSSWIEASWKAASTACLPYGSLSKAAPSTRATGPPCSSHAASASSRSRSRTAALTLVMSSALSVRSLRSLK